MKYLNALNKIPGIGSQKLRLLLAHFETEEKIWQAEPEELKKSGLGEKLSETVFWERKKIDPDQEWEKLEKENISVLAFYEKDYPQLLKESPNPPFLLYKKGSIDLNSSPMISIVGSRNYSDYGARAAEFFAGELARAGMIVVSGMAMGIDTFAHNGALGVQGTTVAVLGNSLDQKNIYPRVNLALAQKIARSGALLSEYSPETSAGPMTFPARNRIVAGLSLGTLVIEAGEKSGALITAQMALDANREVFSLPGPIFSPASAGTNELLKKGAKAVTGIKDILEELSIEKISTEQKNRPEGDTPEEKIILKILGCEPVHIDKITKISKLQISACSSILAMMEIKGWIKNIGGQNYIIL